MYLFFAGKFKATMDFQHGRHRRSETTLKIRKDKKNHLIKKKRMEHTNVNEVNISKLRYAMQLLPSASLDQKISIVEDIRKTISKDESLVQFIVGSSTINHLVSNLAQSDNSSLVYQILWTLTNITSTQYTKDVAAAGAIGPVISHFKGSDDPDIMGQAAWCLGNFAGDCEALKEQVMCGGIFPSL
jgi:hypothetical protein